MKFPSVEIEKRDRDEHTDTLIKSLLDEEKANKKQRVDVAHADVGAKPAVPQAYRGKTFAEIEAEEGGPIKESMVGMAQTKRALDRKKRDVDAGDTDVVTNTERYEKDTLEVEQEDGITFEPFNLKQEREEGFFDDDGNYVLRKQGGEEGDDEKDAWLTSEEAKVVSVAVRRKIEEQRIRDDEAARRGPLTDRQIAQRKADMAAIMRPDETVTGALKRLGAAAGGATGAAGLPQRAMGKRERARLLALQQQQQQAADGAAAASASATDGDAREQFTLMTELADELLGEGELEIYSGTREELLRAARMWLPQLLTAAPPPAPEVQAAAAAAAAGDGTDDDDDMFADDAPAAKPLAPAVDQDQDMFADDDGDGDAAGAAAGGGGGNAGSVSDRAAVGGSGRTNVAGGAQSNGAAAAAVAAAAAAAADGAAPSGTRTAAADAAAALTGGAGDAVDYGSWPIKELKRLLQERGVDPSGFVEKAELVAKVREVTDAAVDAAVRPAAAGAGGGDAAFIAPPGYVYDPSSGYFYSEDSGMFYDTSSGGYCQAASGKWFYLDAASGAFVDWKQGGQ